MGMGAIICTFLIWVLRSVGQVLKIVRSVEKKWDNYAIEHEIIVSWMCEVRGMKLSDLPTRTGGLKV